MTTPPKRILIVDDEAEMVTALCEYLSPRYVVDTASNGAGALAAVLGQRPDVILLDIAMPGTNGVEVLKEILRVDSTIPVIMVTANEDNALAEDALKSGAFAYLPKPFDVRYVDHLVSTALDRRGRRPRPPAPQV